MATGSVVSRSVAIKFHVNRVSGQQECCHQVSCQQGQWSAGVLSSSFMSTESVVSRSVAITFHVNRVSGQQECCHQVSCQQSQWSAGVLPSRFMSTGSVVSRWSAKSLTALTHSSLFTTFKRFFIIIDNQFNGVIP